MWEKKNNVGLSEQLAQVNISNKIKKVKNNFFGYRKYNYVI